MGVEGVLIKGFDDGAVRLVVEALPALFLYHFSFVLERLLGNLQVAHPVGLEPERNGQHGTGHRLPEYGHILSGVGVVEAAVPDDVIGKLFRAYVLGTLIH